MNNDEAKELTLAQAVTPEDIRPDDYVSVLYEIWELLSLASLDDWRPIEPRRVRFLPDDVGPMRVVEVCLPFVLVCAANGKHRTIDVRKCRLARVSERFGRKTFKRVGSRPEAAV